MQARFGWLYGHQANSFKLEETKVASDAFVKPTLRQKGLEEFKALIILTVYLWITLGAVILMKAAVLHGVGIPFVPWGVAIVKAAVLAKFLLIGRAMKFGESHTSGPLIWPMLHKAFGLLVMLVVLTIGEEVIVGLFHHEPAAATLRELAGSRLYEFMASILIVFLVLIPYCAIEVLNTALGDGRLARMFLVDRQAVGTSL